MSRVRRDQIKEYFLKYNECMSNDFVYAMAAAKSSSCRSDIEDWRITFVDTGHQANIGQRLVAVRNCVEDDMFLANYSDGLPIWISGLVRPMRRCIRGRREPRRRA